MLTKRRERPDRTGGCGGWRGGLAGGRRGGRAVHVTRDQEACARCTCVHHLLPLARPGEQQPPSPRPPGRAGSVLLPRRVGGYRSARRRLGVSQSLAVSRFRFGEDPPRSRGSSPLVATCRPSTPPRSRRRLLPPLLLPAAAGWDAFTVNLPGRPPVVSGRFSRRRFSFLDPSIAMVVTRARVARPADRPPFASVLE